MASGGLCGACDPSCVPACLSSLDLNYVWGVLGGRTEHNHPPRWLGLVSRAVCGTKGNICSSELNKSQWPRLGAARPGVSSSEKQRVCGGTTGFSFRVLQLCTARIKESNVQLSPGGLKHYPRTTKRVLCSFGGWAQSLSWLCWGESFVPWWSPQGCVQRPSAEPGFWCE